MTHLPFVVVVPGAAVIAVGVLLVTFGVAMLIASALLISLLFLLWQVYVVVIAVEIVWYFVHDDNRRLGSALSLVLWQFSSLR